MIILMQVVAQCAKQQFRRVCHQAMWGGTSSIIALCGVLIMRKCELWCDMIENVEESSERGESNKYYGNF